jgi:hypothetical protein
MAYRFNMAAALIMSVISGFSMAVKGPGDGAAVELGSARPVILALQVLHPLRLVDLEPPYSLRQR